MLGVCTALAVCAVVASSAFASAKPVITGLNATPPSVPSGGTTTISASVSGATSCTLSAKGKQPVNGLPVTFNCESGSVSRELSMPTNYGKKALSFKLTLLATGGSGTGKAKVTVTVSNRTPPATQVAVGNRSACAVMYNGHVMCWGNASEGNLGDGKTKESLTPIEVSSIRNAVQVSAGQNDGCALLATKHIDCWGANEIGELGNGSTAEKALSPVEVQGISSAVQVAAGSDTTCALLEGGHVDCWGDNEAGELANTTAGAKSDVPVEALGVSNAVALAAGGDFACALLASGHVACWGQNEAGQLGIGTTTGPEKCNEGVEVCSTQPLEVPGITNAVSIASAGAHQYGRGHVCVTLSTGRVECWGEWRNQLEHEEVIQTSPTEVTGIETATGAAATGDGASCIALATGHVVCWGFDWAGAFGNGTRKSHGFDESPEEASIESVTQVAAAGQTFCALKRSADVFCWGEGINGELGDGKQESSSVPVEVSGI